MCERCKKKKKHLCNCLLVSYRVRACRTVPRHLAVVSALVALSAARLGAQQRTRVRKCIKKTKHFMFISSVSCL